MKAMVLAAGVGSRLDPLTSQLPKPLVPIANIPVMEHIVNLLRTHGFEDVMANLHYLPDKIVDYFQDGSRCGVNLAFKFEPELTGDAGGVRACRDFFGNETFIVLMGDLLTDADLTRIIAAHKRKKALATIAVKEVDDVSQFGVVVRDQDGFIKGFQEKPAPEEAFSNYASTGIYILEPEVFEYMPKEGTYGFGRQLFPQLVEKGLPVLGMEINSHYWSDVGTIAQYRKGNMDAVAGKLEVQIPGQEHVSGSVIGENAQISALADINGKLVLGRNSSIAPGVVIEGTVIIGDDCRVESGAHLKDTIVWNDTTVRSAAQMVGCVVGSGCEVSSGTVSREIATVSWPPPPAVLTR